MSDISAALVDPLTNTESGEQRLVPADAGQTLALTGSQDSASLALSPVPAPDDPELLTACCELLAKRHGISLDAATALALAALAAAIGPVRTISNPLGDTLTASLNVVVEDAAGAPARRAARQALAAFQRRATTKIRAHQARDAKEGRQIRIELEAACAQALRRLASPRTTPPETLTIPVPDPEPQTQALAKEIQDAEAVAQAMRLFEFEQQPFVLADGLPARDIPAALRRSFDGAVLNYCPDGQGFTRLQAMRPEDRRTVLRFLQAAWHGEPFVCGAETVVAPVVTNLWLAAPGATAQAWRNPALAASGLLETVLVAVSDAEDLPDPTPPVDPASDDAWHTLMEVIMGERIMGEIHAHTLSPAAVQRFLEFHARTRRHATPETHRVLAWWPEQVLKVALILHVSAGETVAPEIDTAVLARAITLIERLGSEQLRAARSRDTQPGESEVEMEFMLAKVRLNGPLSRRDLFRRFNVQKYDKLEPVLARCLERNLVRMEDGVIYPVLPEGGG